MKKEKVKKLVFNIEIFVEVPFKDPESGLFVQKRSEEIKKAAIPKDCLAFQV